MTARRVRRVRGQGQTHCTGCGRELNAENGYKDGRRPGRYRPRCRQCVQDYFSDPLTRERAEEVRKVRRRDNGARERDTAAERERYRNNQDAINKRRRERRAARAKEETTSQEVTARPQTPEPAVVSRNGLEVGKLYEFIQPGALKAFVWEDPGDRLNIFGIRVPAGTKFQVLEMHWTPAGADVAPAVKVTADIPMPKTSARGNPIRDVVLAVGRSVLATGAAQPVAQHQARHQ
ncbi:hypothetical protein BKG82_27335 [Mycobacteroides chelonae]|uniref:Uncharacterized protein n=1 Tax=Mycobacteroides chelonae TaxID=1774 RepID=A0A1S1LGT5_MYCCH|nr:hypothetical protein [Mycobacteroides chelonae]OHU47365.1 hypothetical protein BKG82_27335 [Mycobacteroides chelonae]